MKEEEKSIHFVNIIFLKFGNMFHQDLVLLSPAGHVINESSCGDRLCHNDVIMMM